jgi:hypothetical protein
MVFGWGEHMHPRAELNFRKVILTCKASLSYVLLLAGKKGENSM